MRKGAVSPGTGWLGLLTGIKDGLLVVFPGPGFLTTVPQTLFISDIPVTGEEKSL
jgi:hypothetical protein